MKLVLALVVASLALFAIPPASATMDPPACVGYEWCYEASGDGFAIFCVKWKGSWVCGQCESCGNGPWGLERALS